MSDTPISDSTPHNIAELGMLCRKLERLAAVRLGYIQQLEEQLMDTKNKHAVLIADVVLNEDRAEQIKRLRKANLQLREGAEEQKQRIKRLEKACGEMVSEEDTYIRLQTWLKAKEDKP